MYLITYGQACAENIDPIEKKPLFNFLPGTQTLTVATVGCNFRCAWCQNYQISQITKDIKARKQWSDFSFTLSPKKIVADAIKNNCPSISYSYTEPTIFMDYALDSMKLAKKKG
ncbi:MAG: AmmeMemoRadiSam system radical SAM enzyme, partial [Patescibacteria group bacterium]|nr:AmmeMemoRadiSam system radical SAM enzyme [Patescibacteria group bacterium]